MIDGNALFRSAVDEPAPPAPPEAIEDRDDDGGDPCTCPAPALVVLDDGSVSARSWGVGLLAWLGVSTGVTVLWLLSSVANYFTSGPFGLRAGLVAGGVTMVLMLIAGACAALLHQRGRAFVIVLLMVAMTGLGAISAMWWWAL